MFARNRDTSWMNLRVTRIREGSTLLISTPWSGDIATFRVGRKVEDVSVSTCAENDCVRSMGGNFSRDHVTDNDALGMSIDDHQFQHLRARIHLHLAQTNLP